MPCATCGRVLPSKTQLFKHLKSGESPECTKVAEAVGFSFQNPSESIKIEVAHPGVR